MTPEPDPTSGLLAFAQGYQHNPTQQANLEPYKDAILLLRAKYASYEIITDALNERGMKVSIASVRKLCRRCHADMKRLRARLETERRAAKEGQAPVPSAPAAEGAPEGAGAERPPLTPETGKRGPRIARDQL